MNITAINSPQPRVNKINSNYKTNSNLLTQKINDEVTFKGISTYEKVMKESVSDWFNSTFYSTSFFDRIYKALFAEVGAHSVKVTDDFKLFSELKKKNAFIGLMEKLIGVTKPTDSYEKDLIEQLVKKSAKGDLTFATINGIPVFELKQLGMKGIGGRKNIFSPQNLYELKFTSTSGGSEIVMGINKNAETSLEQISNMTLPKYTLFYPGNMSGVKVLTQGVSDEPDFIGKYFNKNGSYNSFLSMFLC